MPGVSSAGPEAFCLSTWRFYTSKLTMAEKTAEILSEESSISHDVLKNASSRTTIAASVREVDGLVVLGMSQDDLDFYEGFTPQKRSRLNRKVCYGGF